MTVCGAGDKVCATCLYGDCGCIASTKGDYYVPASKEAVIERLNKSKFRDYQQQMKEFLDRNCHYDCGTNREPVLRPKEDQPVLRPQTEQLMNWKEAIHAITEDIIDIIEHDRREMWGYEDGDETNLDFEFPACLEKEVAIDGEKHKLEIFCILDDELPASLRWNRPI